jgi:hypothetical protein
MQQMLAHVYVITSCTVKENDFNIFFPGILKDFHIGLFVTKFIKLRKYIILFLLMILDLS